MSTTIPLTIIHGYDFVNMPKRTPAMATAPMPTRISPRWNPVTPEKLSRRGKCQLRGNNQSSLEQHRGAPFTRHAALVFGLLFLGRPATICRFVVAVVVDTIDRCALWARPHVREEIGERLSPSIANSDTSASIIFIPRSFWVMAAFLRRLPGIVFPASCHPVNSFCVPSDFVLQASTTTGPAFKKRIALDDSFVSAIAPNFPANLIASIGTRPDHEPSAEPLTKKIESSSTPATLREITDEAVGINPLLGSAAASAQTVATVIESGNDRPQAERSTDEILCCESRHRLHRDLGRPEQLINQVAEVLRLIWASHFQIGQFGIDRLGVDGCRLRGFTGALNHGSVVDDQSQGRTFHRSLLRGRLSQREYNPAQAVSAFARRCGLGLQARVCALGARLHLLSRKPILRSAFGTLTDNPFNGGPQVAASFAFQSWNINFKSQGGSILVDSLGGVN